MVLMDLPDTGVSVRPAWLEVAGKASGRWVERELYGREHRLFFQRI